MDECMNNKIVATRAHVINSFEISMPESLRLMIRVMGSFNEKQGAAPMGAAPKPVIRDMLREFINSGNDNSSPHVRYLNEHIEVLVEYFTNIELTKYYRAKVSREASPSQDGIDEYEQITQYLEQNQDTDINGLIFSYYFIFAFQFYVGFCCQYQRPSSVNFLRSVDIILNPREADLEGVIVISSFSAMLDCVTGMASQYSYFRAVSSYILTSAVEGTEVPLPILLRLIHEPRFWEAYFNINTFADIDTLFEGYIGDDVIETKHKDAVPYAPTEYDVIGDVLGYLEITDDDVFVDLGCGKGRVCNVVAASGAKKVIGVDCNPEFVEIARENSLRNTRRKIDIEIVTEDAANYVSNDGTVFFMFNSFGEETLRDVLRNIKESLQDNPRKVRIAYFFPAFKEVMDEEDWLELKEYPGGIYIWESR